MKNRQELNAGLVDNNSGLIVPVNIRDIVDSAVLTTDVNDFSNGGTIINLPEPTNAQDAATKNYVDTNIPPAQVNSDWNATEGVAQILNQPTDLVHQTDLVAGDNITIDTSSLPTIRISAGQVGGNAAQICQADAEYPSSPEGGLVIDWNDGLKVSQIYNQSKSGCKITGVLYAVNNDFISVDPTNRQLNDGSGETSLDWNSGYTQVRNNSESPTMVPAVGFDGVNLVNTSNGTNISASLEIAIAAGSAGTDSIQANDAYASGNYSFAENQSTASGEYAHSEGTAWATGDKSHAEGESCYAVGVAAHAEGQSTSAYDYSHAEGQNTVAYSTSHAEGIDTQANADAGHVEGNGCIIDVDSYNASHAQGWHTRCNGWTTFAMGRDSIADTYGQVVHSNGKFISSGDNQLSLYTLRGGNNTPTTITLHPDGEGSHGDIIVPNLAFWGFRWRIACIAPEERAYAWGNGILFNNNGIISVQYQLDGKYGNIAVDTGLPEDKWIITFGVSAFMDDGGTLQMNVQNTFEANTPQYYLASIETVELNIQAGGGSSSSSSSSGSGGLSPEYVVDGLYYGGGGANPNGTYYQSMETYGGKPVYSNMGNSYYMWFDEPNIRWVISSSTGSMGMFYATSQASQSPSDTYWFGDGMYLTGYGILYNAINYTDGAKYSGDFGNFYTVGDIVFNGVPVYTNGTNNWLFYENGAGAWYITYGHPINIPTIGGDGAYLTAMNMSAAGVYTGLGSWAGPTYTINAV